jgi:drug/metabolite transporter (DMT)-like permease
LIICLVLRTPFTGYPPHSYLNFFALGVVTQIIGYLSVSYALGYLPASIVSPTMLGQPLLTAILAAIFLGEKFSVWQVFGGIAVMSGVYLVHASRGVEVKRISGDQTVARFSFYLRSSCKDNILF